MEDEKNYYHAEDFEIGKTVDIAGRSILIHDCDGFTKKFFKTNYDKGTDYSIMMIMNNFFYLSFGITKTCLHNNIFNDIVIP